MTDSVTNLKANWIQGVGVQLNWDAPADVTIGSRYRIYVLENTGEIFPDWLLVQEIKSGLILDSKSFSYVATPPTNSYLFPWVLYQKLINSFVINKNVSSLAFTVSQVDKLGKESASTNVTVFSTNNYNKNFPQYSPQHLPNVIVLGSNGGFATVGQDSQEEVSECVSMFFGTQLGQRTAVPGYGVEDLAFENIDANQLQNDVSVWEPRANATVGVIYNDQNQSILNVKINTNLGNV